MELSGKRVLTIVSDDFDDLELWYPILRLREAGAHVDIAAELSGTTYRGKYGLSVVSDLKFSDVDITRYDGLVIPGGWAQLSSSIGSILDFVKYMDSNKR